MSRTNLWEVISFTQTHITSQVKYKGTLTAEFSVFEMRKKVFGVSNVFRQKDQINELHSQIII